jgi:hypothetical protein
MLLTNRPPFLLWANDGRSWQEFKALRSPLYTDGTFEIHVGVGDMSLERKVLGHPTIFHEFHYSLQLTITSQTKYSIDLTRRPTIV